MKNDSMNLLAQLSVATDQLLDVKVPTARTSFAISPKLVAAVALVISSSAFAETAKPALAKEIKWDVDTAILFYSETDRVTAIEPVVSATRVYGEDRAWNVKLVVDSLTGASPTGAVPSSAPQTYTRPSGNGNYTIGANEQVLDDTFLDTRVALRDRKSVV